MRRHMAAMALPAALALLGALANAQNIFTIVGIPVSHRDLVDGVPALSATLGAVYGLLLDNSTGRVIFNDEEIVLRLEPDRSLLTLAGTGAYLRSLSGAPAGGNLLASALQF